MNEKEASDLVDNIVRHFKGLVFNLYTLFNGTKIVKESKASKNPKIKNYIDKMRN
jgi:hypothetical protein